MKILLAVDGSVHSDAAVEELTKRPWPAQTEIKVITASEVPVPMGMEPWAVSPQYFEVMEKSMRQAAEAAIDSALLKLKPIEDKTLGISSKIVPGPPSQAIVDEAESWGANLIVMGSRGQGTWSRLLLGSVSSAVVHHATCSVEIVRKPQNKERDKAS
jgi:nucleotide-binding universal stress UspA family protein